MPQVRIFAPSDQIDMSPDQEHLDAMILALKRAADAGLIGIWLTPELTGIAGVQMWLPMGTIVRFTDAPNRPTATVSVPRGRIPGV